MGAIYRIVDFIEDVFYEVKANVPELVALGLCAWVLFR